MKQCSKCKEIKSLDDFYRYSKAKDGKQKTCIACQKAYSKSDVCKKNRREYYKKNREAHIGRNMRQWYGITYDDYQQMLLKQDGKCAICRQESSGGKGRLHVDHCHTTGKVRGLLCHYCNTMIGLAKESVSNLESAINYINEHRQA
jgi:hypothetical protein